MPHDTTARSTPSAKFASIGANEQNQFADLLRFAEALHWHIVEGIALSGRAYCGNVSKKCARRFAKQTSSNGRSSTPRAHLPGLPARKRHQRREHRARALHLKLLLVVKYAAN